MGPRKAVLISSGLELGLGDTAVLNNISLAACFENCISSLLTEGGKSSHKFHTWNLGPVLVESFSQRIRNRRCGCMRANTQALTYALCLPCQNSKRGNCPRCR